MITGIVIILTKIDKLIVGYFPSDKPFARRLLGIEEAIVRMTIEISSYNDKKIEHVNDFYKDQSFFSEM